MADTYDGVARREGAATGAPPPHIVTVSDGRWDLAIAALGFFALFLPTYYDLATTTWTDPRDSIGLFIVPVAIGAGVGRWRAFLDARGGAPIAGTIALVFGMLLYVLGRSQEFLVLETAAQIPIIAGIILMLKGWQGLRVYWFPVVFLVFTIVWPTWLIDKLTVPLKQVATDFTVNTLGALGYPIAATGVIIQIERYALLVADACSGLNTMVSLLSVGVLYLYIVRRSNWLWNAAIVAALPFIAFAANVLRVMVLTLITYHFGDRAGQSFIHDFTGIFLFGVALGLVFLIDLGIEKGVELTKAAHSKRSPA